MHHRPPHTLPIRRQHPIYHDANPNHHIHGRIPTSPLLSSIEEHELHILPGQIIRGRLRGSKHPVLFWQWRVGAQKLEDILTQDAEGEEGVYLAVGEAGRVFEGRYAEEILRAGGRAEVEGGGGPGAEGVEAEIAINGESRVGVVEDSKSVTD